MMLRSLLVCLCFGMFYFVQAQLLQPDEVNIEMRDGKFLLADVYVPAEDYPRPTILLQTPYNKNLYRWGLPLNTGINIDASPYNFVIVDWRGFFGSSNAIVAQPNRGEDGYDVIDWIVSQTWSDGKVGTWGASALGKIQYETAREQHPAHICAVPLVVTPEFLYQTYYPNGVYRTEYLEQLDALGYGLSTTVSANPYFNAVWNFVQNNNFYPEQIQIPVLMIAGWFDHNLLEMLKYFEDLRNFSPQSVASKHKLLIGPWAHGGFGPVQVGSEQQGELFFPEAQSWSTQKAIEFFAYYLLDADNGWESVNPPVKYFQMGTNTWHASNTWPPDNTMEQYFYLHHNNSISLNYPDNNHSYSEIIYDPADPSPTIGGATLRQDLLQGPYDQTQEVESRDDILTFTTEIVTNPIAIKGRPIVRLYVESDRLDTDFAIRLCDVYPDNRSILIGEGIFRMRFREGFTVNDEIFMQPGEIYAIDIQLSDIAHTFMPGHAIRLNITSSNYPRFDNNLNNGGEMYTPGDTLIATNKVHHNLIHPSALILDIESITSISKENKNLVTIFPNPIREKEVLTIKSDNQISDVNIFNIKGAKVANYLGNNKNEVSINISGFSPGVYYVLIDTDNGSDVEKLIIK